MLYSERNLAGDAPVLLKIALGAGGHKLLHKHMEPTLETIGRYVEPDLYLPLCLPHLRKPDVGHAELGRLLASIATLLGASAETQVMRASKLYVNISHAWIVFSMMDDMYRSPPNAWATSDTSG